MRILWSFPIAFFTISQWYGSFGIGEGRFLSEKNWMKISKMR